MKKKKLALLVATGLLTATMITACGESSSETTAETTVAETEADEEWADVKSLGLDNNTMISIYNEYEDAWKSSPEDPSKEAEYEEQVATDIGNKYGISPDSADLVYMYVMANYDNLAAEAGADINDMKLSHGELQDVTTNGSSIVLKAKIKSSYSKEATIQGCFFSVYEAIQDYGLNQYSQLQYWAVADMTNGTEQKVISFTIPQDVLEGVANETILENQLINYATDVWLAPALQ